MVVRRRDRDHRGGTCRRLLGLVTLSDQGKEYAGFIAAELKLEHERRDLANARAVGVLTSATGLVTVAVVVLAVLLGKDAKLAGGARVALLVSLLALLGTAALALYAGMAKGYNTTSVRMMRAMIGTHWTDSEVTARNVIAECNVTAIDALRSGTNFKYRILAAAGISQIAAVIALILCVVLAL